MRSRRIDCEILSPALVAYVHDELHPEIPKVFAHLRACERCRQEERDLRETRNCLLGAGEGILAARARGRLPTSKLFSPSSHLWIAAAGFFVICVLFSRGRQEPASDGWSSEGWASDKCTAAPASSGPVRQRLRPAAAPSCSFSGREIDDRIDLVERELAFLEQDSLEEPVR